MANSTFSFILGILTVLVIIAGVYMYIDFTKTEKKVANYNADPDEGEAYVYDNDNPIIEEAIDDAIMDDIASDSVPANKGIIRGKLCFPSHFLPEGEIVAKNTDTNELTNQSYPGNQVDYELILDPGTYNLRYQAHVAGDESYSSGYYTKCGMDSTADICNESDAHELIDVSIDVGEVIENVNLCDFYYEEEPEF